MTDNFPRFSIIFQLFAALLVLLWTPCAQSSVDTTDSLWQEVLKTGHTQRSGKPDKVIRPLFTQIQANFEKEITAVLGQDPKRRALIIIHTPLITTPLVKTDSERAMILRKYLANGGILVTAYQVNGKKRSKSEMDIFNALKQQYPNQLIELPLKEKIPTEFIGATYVAEDSLGRVLEMTLQGVQMQDAKDNATWGIWFQLRNQTNSQVNKRLNTIIEFLETNGLAQVLKEPTFALLKPQNK